MTKFLFAAVAAVSLFGAQPVFACPDCKNCPHKAAAADKKPVEKACACEGKDKDCKCEKAACPHCSEQKAAPKKEEAKKT